MNGPLGHAGRWLTDNQNRVVTLHGVNLVNKRFPYDPGALGFDREHARHLAAEGFNGVRLGIIWKALEPRPGEYDDGYLERIAATASLMGDTGLHVLLDFHQDLWHERFGGEGAPDWAVADERLPALPNLGFPLNYLVMPALWRAYDRFWDNHLGSGGIGLQDRFAAAWRHVALRFRDEPHVFGYDVLNEPFPGSAIFGSPIRPVARRFQRKLSAFHERVLRAIREVDQATLVFFEPGFGSQAGAVEGPNTGLSFHCYCAAAAPGLPRLPGWMQERVCARQQRRAFERAERHSLRHDAALLLTEFGASDDPRDLVGLVDRADRHLASWLYWAYWNQDAVRARPEEGIVRNLARAPTADNVKQGKLDLLVRPYARAVAGTPVRLAFDRERRALDLAYVTSAPSGDSTAAEARTEVVVPARQYPDGYRVEVEGARVASQPGAAVLELVAEPGAGLVSVGVRGPARRNA